LALGPGLGFTRGTEPSITKVTYYGPIANTRLGKVLFDTDRVIFALETNVDGRTGKVLTLHELPGFRSQLEIIAREEIAFAKQGEKKETVTPAKDKGPDDAPWWEKAGWFVWVPEKISLRRSNDGGSYVFDSVGLALRIWGGSARKISKSSVEITDYATEHLDLLKGVFPVLDDFEDAAKTVSVIRALKSLGIPLDTAWARKFKQPLVTTEQTFRYVSVFDERKGGLPVFEVAQ